MAKQTRRQQQDLTLARIELSREWSHTIGRVAPQAVKWAAWAFIAWCALQAFRELAGKTTVLAFVTDLAVKISLANWIGWAVGVVAGVWAIMERNIRVKKTMQLGDRIQSLESRLDENRTSSGLARTGHPPESDL